MDLEINIPTAGSVQVAISHRTATRYFKFLYQQKSSVGIFVGKTSCAQPFYTVKEEKFVADTKVKLKRRILFSHLMTPECL